MVIFATPPASPDPLPPTSLLIAQNEHKNPLSLSVSNKIPPLSANTSATTFLELPYWPISTIYEKYPELRYLAMPDVNVSSESAALSMEGEQLFPSQNQYPEFSRSIQSLRCLNWIILGNNDAYEQFISSQDEPKLTRESFQLLHDVYKKLETIYSNKYGWRKPDILRDTLEAALVMGDLGKSTAMRKQFHAYGITAFDHDDFYAQLMQSDSALKTFTRFQELPESAQALLKKTADIAHFGHITHLEGGAQMFAGIEKSKLLLQSEPEAFDFAWLVHLCDVAGALGHKVTQGSKVLNQATFENMQLTYKACKLLIEQNQDGKTAINQLINDRSKWLEINSNDPDREVLARLSAMLRVTPLDKGKGKQLVEAYRSLPSVLKEQARQELSIASADDLPLTPTYIPAMLINAVAYAQKTEKNYLRSALQTSLPLLCKALSLYRQGIKDGSISKVIRLDFNHLAGLISKNKQLDVNQLSVDSQNGQVYIRDKTSKIKAFFMRFLRIEH